MIALRSALLVLLPLGSTTAFAPSPRTASIGSRSAVASQTTVPLPRTSAVTSSAASPSTRLHAKKRRRRKEAPSADTAAADELPDFDDGDDAAAADASSPAPSSEDKADADAAAVSPLKAAAAQFKSANPTPVRRGDGLSSALAEEVGGNVDGLDEDTILEAMRGKNWAPPASIEDTLRDRSLERFMDFERMIEADGGEDGVVADLPDFEEVISRRKVREAASGGASDGLPRYDPGLGKKAQRNAQRKAEAVRREAEIEAEKSPFDALEDVNFLDLLQNGAWAGIGLLVLWEFYINSPFFDRAAPLIPVVYDKLDVVDKMSELNQ